jgi:hypothetical protein
MKKILLCMALVLFICASVSSLETENWLSLGISVNSILESGDALDSMYMGSIGFDLGLYSFFNKTSWGVFFNAGVFIPFYNTLKVYKPENIPAPMTQFGFMIGPAYRHNINEKMNLRFAAGFNLDAVSFYTSEGNTRSQHINTMFGIGADAGFQYDLNELFHLSAGLKLGFNFANWKAVETTRNNWENAEVEWRNWVNGYAMFGVRPYIAIGFYSYMEGMGLGKPAVY